MQRHYPADADHDPADSQIMALVILALAVLSGTFMFLNPFFTVPLALVAGIIAIPRARRDGEYRNLYRLAVALVALTLLVAVFFVLFLGVFMTTSVDSSLRPGVPIASPLAG